MRNFYDENTDIYWYETQTDDDKKEMQAITNKINKWQSPGIKKYVTDGLPVIAYLSAFTYSEIYDNLGKIGCYNYYALDENKTPLGIVEVSTSSVLPNRATIEFLVVNPKLNGQGIGTRMISSIQNNTEWFAQNDKINRWVVSIDNSNEPSKKAFLKNKFKAYKKNPDFQIHGFETKLERYYWLVPKQKSKKSNEKEI